MTATSLNELKAHIDTALDGFLPAYSQIAPAIIDAMRHGVLGGGKRMRPMLACAAAEACGGTWQSAIPAGCATELIHAYSLIHDDLPAMDDDELRHGLPSTHIAFGEANAILAGDSLHSLAFQIIANDQALGPATQVQMISLLAKAAGWAGMAGGQCLDIEAEGRALGLQQLHALHGAKTGALIKVAVQMGCLSAMGAEPDAQTFRCLGEYGDHIGLAFQVMDDILDLTQTTEQLGKPAGSDESLDKSTFPKLMGLDAARDYANDLVERAKASVSPLGSKHSKLLELAELVIHRDH